MKLLLPVFPVLNIWMVDAESLIVFGSRVGPVIAGGACFDPP